jgi:hypothetical protein
MIMDETLYSIADKVKNFAVIYLVDITEVPDFNKMYEIYDPCTVMFFFRNKHIMVDLGTGNNNKINWSISGMLSLVHSCSSCGRIKFGTGLSSLTFVLYLMKFANSYLRL